MSLHPRISGCTFIQPGLSLTAEFDLAKQFGFHTVDFGCATGRTALEPLAVAADPLGCADAVCAEAARVGVALNECFMLNFGWPLNHPDSSRREETVVKFAEFAKFLAEAGFKSVLLLAGGVHPETGPKGSLAHAVEVLGRFVTVAEAYDFAIHVEADYESCVASPSLAVSLCEQVPGLKLTLDYSHFICQSYAQSEVRQLHAHVGNVHIRQAAPDRIVDLVGAGSIDMDTLVSTLLADGYTGQFCVEYLACQETTDCGVVPEVETPLMSQALHTILTQYQA